MIIQSTCLAAFAMGVFVTQRVHKKSVKVGIQTAVSRRPADNFKASKHSRLAVWASAVFGVGALACIALFSLPLWTIGATVFLFLITMVFASQSNKMAAKRSAPLRYLRALQAPIPQQARYALYFSEPRLLTPYQVTMWLAPLLSLGEPFVILLKERKHMKHFPKDERFDVLVVSDIPASIPFLPPNTEVVFYVNNSMVNLGGIQANPHVTHVQLLHGDSDKPPSYNPMSRVYDKLFVAGEMAIDRYARHGVPMDRAKFEIVGRPQLTVPNRPAPNPRKTIVYMTTWAGMFEDSNFCSLSQAHDILHRTVTAVEKVDVVFKPHPISMKDPIWKTVESKIQNVSKDLPDGVTFRLASHDENPLGLYQQADVLITDVSSTLIDFLYTGKPYLVTNPHGCSPQDLDKYPSIKGGGLLMKDCSNLQKLLADCFDEDTLRETRLKLRTYAFGDFGRPQGEAFQEACAALLTTSPQASHHP